MDQPKLDERETELQTLLDKEVSKASITKIMEISRTALYNFISSAPEVLANLLNSGKTVLIPQNYNDLGSTRSEKLKE